LIANGTIVTYTGSWPHGEFTTADDMVQQVLAKLVTSGFASRSAPVVDATFVTTLGGNFQVTLQLEVQNGIGYGSPDDVISIIRHWVYVVSGAFPTGDSIPVIQTPHNIADPSQLPPGTTVQTGQPGATATKSAGCVAGAAYDLGGSFNLGCWWDNLTTKGLSTVGLLAITIVVGVGIFIYARAPRISAL